MVKKYTYTIFLSSLALTTVIFILLRKLSKRADAKIKRILLILLILAYTLNICRMLFVTFGKNYINFQNDLKEGNIAIVLIIKDRFPMVIGNVIYMVNLLLENDKYADTSEIKNFHESVIGKQEKEKNKLVVLVIGESSLSSRYSAYGYSKRTTPNIERLFSQSNACIVSDAHSSAPVTRDSVSMTLSFFTPENEAALFNSKSIIEMAKDNGYETYWIGSQSLKGLYDSKYGFIAKKSDYISLTDMDDDKLPGLLEKAVKNSSNNKFIIIHLWGNHQPYKNFDQIDRNALPNAEEYDLTIHHTDRIIESLFNTLDNTKQPYSAIYTSDHGEIINKGHGFDEGRDQYFIPFLYKSSNPEFDCQFIESFRNKDGWLSGLMNKFILSSLIGYQIDSHILDKEKNHDRILKAGGQVILFSEAK